jgi:transposase
MIDYPDKVLVYNGFADMRRSIDGLSILVHQEMSTENSHDTVFVFINKVGDKIKILHKQNTGFCLFYKRLDRGCFKINIIQNESLILSKQQLRWLLEGLDYTKLSSTKTHKNSGHYTAFF